MRKLQETCCANRVAASCGRRVACALAGIVLLTLAVYWQSLENGFVNLDDDRYIERNQLIRNIDLGRFFTTLQVMGNYHPLVLLVYSMIYSFQGLNPVAYHTVSLFFHLLNTVLVFFVVLELFKTLEVALIVGLLFGVHPMHVESVAWVSELKDLMYSAFFLSSLFFYIKYLKSGLRLKFYLLSVLLFLLSVLSKGMGTSLSLVILLIDFYFGRKFSRKVLDEKVPYFMISIIFGVVAIEAQFAFGAMNNRGLFTFFQRAVFASYGFVTYIAKILIPFGLSAYYPYPEQVNATIPAFYYVYPIAVLFIVALVICSLNRTKNILFALGFYAATVALVLQLLPVGGAIIADRYSYIPSIGIFLLLAFVFHEFGKCAEYRRLCFLFCSLLILAYSFLAFERTKVWKDGMTLWNDVLEKAEVSLAFNNRGALYHQKAENELTSRPTEARKNFQLAMEDYQKSLQLDPQNAHSWSNLGTVLYKRASEDPDSNLKLYSKALEYLSKAIEIQPHLAAAYSNRGKVYVALKNPRAALEDYTKAVLIESDFADAWYNIGIVYAELDSMKEACVALRRASALGHVSAEEALVKLCKRFELPTVLTRSH